MSVHQPANFNLRGNHWITGHTPFANAPDNTSVPMQLYCSPTSASGLANFNSNIAGLVVYLWHLIKLPEGFMAISQGDIFQPDPTVTDYYLVMRTDHFYLGFPSQFFGCVTHRCNAIGQIILP